MSRGRALGLAAAALAVGVATRRGPGRTLDDRLYKRANTDLQHPVLDRFLGGVTELGSLYASLGAGAALAAGGRRKEAAHALGAALSMWALGQGLKKAFRRPRPWLSRAPGRLQIGKPSGTSWPSSHPAVLVAFATVAARELGLGPLGRGALNALAVSVAASRVVLGVHYPADVVGGLLLGRAVADAWPTETKVG